MDLYEYGSGAAWLVLEYGTVLLAFQQKVPFVLDRAEQEKAITLVLALWSGRIRNGDSAIAEIILVSL